ncbi:MAG: F0F1 ATP synthase subunit epsilon [Sporomusaceae bacterium]|nr:F0F1 ATP synthase subunit epsilon [Sporomusaceae bacterium]
MARTVRVDIVTPDKLAYSGDVNMVIARATDGDLGVLPGHVPLIAALNTWPLRLLTADGEHQISLCGGFIEVQPEKVTILASCAELPEEIDVERAEAAKKRAEERLSAASSEVDEARAHAALSRAIVRLKVASFGAKHH